MLPLLITDILQKAKNSLYYVFIKQLFISPGKLQRNRAGVIILLLFFKTLTSVKLCFVVIL